jgi:uncharacterized membrane protein
VPTVEKIGWLVLGVVALAAAVRAGGSARALYVGKVALGVLFVGAGALVNLFYLVTGADYGTFADAAHFAFVRDTWHTVVAPRQAVFIGALIAFEFAVGVLILSGGRRTELGLAGAIGMHVGLLVFGWIFTIWGVVMLFVFGLLIRAQRRLTAARPVTDADNSRSLSTTAPRRPALEDAGRRPPDIRR